MGLLQIIKNLTISDGVIAVLISISLFLSARFLVLWYQHKKAKELNRELRGKIFDLEQDQKKTDQAIKLQKALMDDEKRRKHKSDEERKKDKVAIDSGDANKIVNRWNSIKLANDLHKKKNKSKSEG